MIRVAFDIGGTFTDFVLHDDSNGGTHVLKISSTPHDAKVAVLAGLRQLLEDARLGGGDVDTVLHDTTVATNAVLERKGAKAGLITTEGFRDVLIIGRQKRYETYDLYIDKPEPLVPRRHIVEVSERMDHNGMITTPLEPSSVDNAVDFLLAAGVETIAVSLLHAYANPAHEQQILARIRERIPDMPVSLSSDVSPKFREYERTNTAVANAYVKPIVERYMVQLEAALKELGYDHELLVMQSSGGLVTPAIAKAFPIRIIESGPAAGVLMGGIVGTAEGYEHVITFDMGGTTAKLGAVDGGTPAIMPTFEVGHVRYKKGSGLPINVPAVELLEIGAGGGSIARTSMGMITVGPESAGANPGPICYGQGGTEPTITDANVILGYIDPDWFNGGAMKLERDAAARGIKEQIADPLDLSLGDAAWGIHLVATMNMENALRVVSVERGRDPRRYAMIAFGGAGPLHAARMARAMGIPQVIVPMGAGVGSAIGLLQAAPRIDVSMTKVMLLDENASSAIAELFVELEARARLELEQIGGMDAPLWTRQGYMRYAGQGFEIQVDLPSGPIDGDFAARAITAFNEAYLQKHKFLDPEARVEAVDWSLAATLPGSRDSVDLANSQQSSDTPGRPQHNRDAWFPEAGGYVTTNIIERRSLVPGETLEGPLIVEDPDSTTVVLPGDTVRISDSGHLIIDIAREAAQ
ncbi:MAG: hydantoinase/oxoprolinase family protein [Rhodospirillaceae bacterium]|nr:hydantoinase/oxoprolinase family protein [Rhodospirillaceae bacterium]